MLMEAGLSWTVDVDGGWILLVDGCQWTLDGDNNVYASDISLVGDEL